METTNRLGIPYLHPAQAQKHVTHNEAIRMLDALVQPCVEALPANVPPTQNEEGTVFALGETPSGVWQDNPNNLAAFQDGAWFFFTPQEGWRFSVKGENKQVFF